MNPPPPSYLPFPTPFAHLLFPPLTYDFPPPPQGLASYATPELLRCPLSIAVLKTKRLDMGQPAALLALALDPPNIADIALSILKLKQV